MNAKAFHLAVHHDNRLRRTELIVGGDARVDRISRQSDMNGIEWFDIERAYYQGTASNTTDSSVTVGMGPQYIVIK